MVLLLVSLLAGWVGECCRVSLVLELLFLRQTLKTFCWDILGMLLHVSGEE